MVAAIARASSVPATPAFVTLVTPVVNRRGLAVARGAILIER